MRDFSLLTIFLMLAFAAQAQNTGHPGGGGPDGEVSEIDLACLSASSQSQELEQKFLKSWGKKTLSTKSFHQLLDSIIIESAIHSLDKIENLKHKRPINCSDEELHQAQMQLSKRPHYQEELSLLKEIAKHRQMGLKNVARGKKCSELFSKQAKHNEALKTVIKLYDKSP
jgi:hypothetical protein